MIKKKDNVTPKNGIRIVNTGIFNFDDLCDGIQSWADSRRYDFTEKEHTNKTHPRGQEVVYAWIFEREIDDYVQFTIRVDFRIIELRKVKVGDKQADKADMEIKIFAFIDFDYKGKWKGPLRGFLMNVYNNYLIKDKIVNVLEVNLYKELMELHDEIKDMLEMYK
ncbi:hypothetical protein CL621_03120 [archaeon]|nr:hypothetical protein [archaeon]|tara:strand:+ start:116 stop:610 length:495 start_codon:yes stop_codon:yes gene_type:complete